MTSIMNIPSQGNDEKENTYILNNITESPAQLNKKLLFLHVKNEKHTLK